MHHEPHVKNLLRLLALYDDLADLSFHYDALRLPLREAEQAVCAALANDFGGAVTIGKMSIRVETVTMDGKLIATYFKITGERPERMRRDLTTGHTRHLRLGLKRGVYLANEAPATTPKRRKSDHA